MVEVRVEDCRVKEDEAEAGVGAAPPPMFTEEGVAVGAAGVWWWLRAALDTLRTGVMNA